MTGNNAASFVGSIPENYDQGMGPVQFVPYAEDLANRLEAVKPRGAMLELACGTGILTRELRARFPSPVRLVATDLNQPMLDYARAKLADSTIEWKQADAMNLPFEKASFGAIACGFGVMFVPDKAVAFREARRVLEPGGVLAFNVWDGLENNVSTRIAQETICSFFGGHEPEFFRTPFGFNDRDLIRRLVSGEGFGQIEMTEVSIVSTSPSARAYANGVIRGTPASHEIRQRGISLDEVVEAVTLALARECGDNPCRSSRRALVVMARAV